MAKWQDGRMAGWQVCKIPELRLYFILPLGLLYMLFDVTAAVVACTLINN